MTDLQSRIAALSPEQRARLESRVADLAAARGPRDRRRIEPRDRARPTPLSFAQQREWALERFRPSNNISGALRLEGEVDLELLSRVLTEVMARHEVLRSTVKVMDRTPVQVVHPVTPIPVSLVDISDLDPEEQRREVRRRYDADVQLPFPPEQTQRMRATVLHLGPAKYVALLTTHHSSSDGWSMAVILREVAALYPAFRHGLPSPLPPPPIQYGDFAVWQRDELGEAAITAELEYWKGVLADIPPRLALPADRPSPVRRSFAGAHCTVVLEGEATEALQRFAGREGVSISVLLLAACGVVLHRYTGQDDLVFGTAVTGRVRTETEQVVGCFANALPLRLRVSREQTLLEVLQRARDVFSGAFAHQDIPFDRLIDELAPKETSQTPLIQMMINVLTTPGDILRQADQALEMEGLRISPEPMDPGPVPIDIVLNVQVRPNQVHLQWHYSSELFDIDTVTALAHQVRHVLERLLEDPGLEVGRVDLLGAPPAANVPDAGTSMAGPGFVERFAARVACAPDDPAVVCDEVVLSYAELNGEANRLARRLHSSGVCAESMVAVVVDSSPWLAVAVLGVLKAGAAYVPVDPGWPRERVDVILADVGAAVVVTTAELASMVEGAAGVSLVVDDPERLFVDGHDLSEVPALGAAAYVVHTSGSTGRPKGVVIEHRSLTTFAADVAQRLGLGVGDRFLQFASPAFDVLAEELFPVWLAGGAVVFPPPGGAGVGIELEAVIDRGRVSVLELPAAFWHEWVRQLDLAGRALPPWLRLVIVGSERVLPERLLMWQKLGVPLMNVYGITETTVSSTFFRLGRDAPAADIRHLPIGTPLPSVVLRILDDDLRPVPVGGVGELYIGGVGVGRGYFASPGLTAHRFIADPEPAGAGTRVYRTGDLVRRRGDGNLEFLSRADAQVKIRGFRIEPAEVESAICRHPQVAQAVVTVQEPVPGNRRLVAHLVPQPRTRVNHTDLRRFLARELPHYLVPAAFVSIERLPVTSNGKTDFERLPAPTDERPDEAEDPVAPRSVLEQQLADIVAAVLGITLVGVDDNFFELGGDSIEAIQVAARAQDEGIQLSPLDLFERPTVAQLAQAATEAGDRPPPDVSQAPEAGPPAAAGNGAAAPTPADFPLARVDQGQLDALLGSIAVEKEV